MTRLGKTLLVGGPALIFALIVAITLTIGWRPFIGPRTRALTARKFEVTPQRLERGKYIFNARSACVDCHSEHDTTGEHQVRAGFEGAGEVMPFEGLPGRIVAPNLTADVQTGAGAWTDDQIARAIREGIGHDGRTLFPMMPYTLYRRMSDEDLAAVVVYIRSLPAVRHELPATDVIFPVKYLIRTVPEPVLAPVNGPDPANRVQWGSYLATMGGCGDCHTPTTEHGEALPGEDFAGGQYFKGAWGEAASANITPDASGISYYDEALFIQALRTGYVRARKLSPLMPYDQFKGMSDDDLKAIFAYLRTVKPVRHHVDNSEPPTYCKLCRTKHGAGDQN